MEPFISKSEFKLAQDCHTKLYYKKQKYPMATTNDPYLEFLADGGYMVGKMAQLLYPDGIEIKGNTEEALAQTKMLMKRDKVVLFEPAVSLW